MKDNLRAWLDRVQDPPDSLGECDECGKEHSECECDPTPTAGTEG